MKKIILFVLTNFIFLFLSINVAQAACTVNNHHFATCFHAYCFPKYVQGWANATEDNPGDCRAACRSWGTSGTYPPDTSYRFKYYNYVRFSSSHVNCAVWTQNPPTGSCIVEGYGGVEESECNF